MTDTLIIEKKGSGGWITLNRPSSLNALSMEMVLGMHTALNQLAEDPAITFVVVHSDHPRAFCAGGDIRALYDNRNNPSFGENYFRQEYALNLRISTFPKPYLSLIDGMCFGGGVGLAVHGAYRIVSERASLAMPETAIGFFPDVGAGFFLNKAPDFSGYCLALTSLQIGAADALFMGLATHSLSMESFSRFKAFLATVETSQSPAPIFHTWLSKEMCALEKGPLEKRRELISTCFSGASLETIKTALQAHTHSFAKELVTMLEERSPTSLKVTLAYLQRTQNKPLKEVLDLDFHLATHFCGRPEFYEGIRAMVVDKDKMPQWHPSSLSHVSVADVQGFFPKIEGHAQKLFV